MKPIYEPKGKAKEYGDYAINIYTGCPHRCFYCYAPNVLHKDREQFHSIIEPRKNIVEEVEKQLFKEQISDKLIHLCFTCDPYPTGYDTTPTREIIKLLKQRDNNVQILTKGNGRRDFDLLDGGDWFGITFDGLNPEQANIPDLMYAHAIGIKTWVSLEPVINDYEVIKFLENYHTYIDKVKIGKLNYHKSDINWKKFGEYIERMCWQYDLDYYIKESLRVEMQKGD